jgi:hypothetical protein
MNDQLTIPGDERLAQRVRQAASRDAISHAVILTGGGDLAPAARFFAAAVECQGQDRPCGVCPACQKVLRGVHPDVITVDDPDHKSLSMETLRSVRSDAYILPNEGRRKLYIFPDCERLDPKTQNVLLKVLEEGPPHASFLFCAQNASLLLPTIRSRAVEWRSGAGEDAAPTDQAAQALCDLLSQKKPAELVAFFADLENRKIEREALKALLSDAGALLSGGLAACYGAGPGDELSTRLAQSLGRRRLSKAADVLQDFARQCDYNIGVGHLTGALAVALEEIVCK